MTEEVIISGIRFNNQLPKWATEATMQEIQEEVVKLVGILSKKDKALKIDRKKEKKEVDEFTKLLSELNDEQEIAQESLKKFRTRINEGAETTSDALEKMRASMVSGYTGVSNVTNIFQSLTTIASTLINPLTMIGSAASLAGLGISSFFNYIKNTSQAFVGLYDNGITFQRGLSDLRLSAAEAALPLDDFGKLLIENSAVVKAFGADGARALGVLSFETRKLLHDQGRYALSIQEVNDYMGPYLETLRLQGLLDKMGRTEQAQASAEYIKNLTLFSQITGKSRKEMERAILSQSKLPEVLALFASLPDEQRKSAKLVFDNLQGVIAGSLRDTGDDLQKIFTMTATNINDFANNDFLQTLQVMDGDLANRFRGLANSIKSGTISETAARMEMADILDGIAKVDGERLYALTSTNNSLQSGALTLSSIRAELQDVNTDLIRTGAAMEPDNLIKKINSLQDVFTIIRGRMDRIFAKFFESNTELLNKVIDGIANFADEMLPHLESLLTNIGDLFDPNTRAQAWKNIKDSIVGGFDYIIGTLFDRIMAMVEIKLGLRDEKEYAAQAQSMSSVDDQLRSKYKIEGDVSKYREEIMGALNLSDLVDDTASFWGDQGSKNKFINAIRRMEQLGIDSDKALEPVLAMNSDLRDYYNTIKSDKSVGPIDVSGGMFPKISPRQTDYGTDISQYLIPSSNPSKVQQANEMAARAMSGMSKSVLSSIQDIAGQSQIVTKLDPLASAYIMETADLMRKSTEQNERIVSILEQGLEADKDSIRGLRDINRNIKNSSNSIK